MIRRLAVAAVLLLAANISSAATLYLTEYMAIPPPVFQAAQTPAVANQTVAISGSSTQSAAFGATTRLIRVHCDAICSVTVGGTNPVATTSILRMVAGQTEYFWVIPGDKLAVIANT